ncbi:MAG TPA: carboxypeptidase-like regulatory domain-containing protein [Candidatus Acidoferrales bacterium]
MRLLAGTLILLLGGVAYAPATPVQEKGAQEKKEEKQEPKKGTRADDQRFLLFGTVFTPRGFALPGAKIEVRRAGEKKVRWSSYSDRLGEFAIRVPPGAEYEMTVTAKDFETMTRKVDATLGVREDMVFRMAGSPGGKKK